MSTDEETPGTEPAAPDEAATAVAEEATRRRPRAKRRKASYLIWTVVMLLLVSGAGAGVGWLLWTAPPKPAAPAGDSAAPVTLQLPTAPALAVTLAPPDEAEAVIAADCRQAVEKVALIAAALGPGLAGLTASMDEAVALPDQRQAGEIAPLAPYQRWEVRLLPDMSVETYARGLDFFHIELAIIGGSKDIVYLSKFSQPKPEQRTSPPRKDRRLYMTWQGSAAADQIMADRAGVSLTDKVIAQFYPPELEDQLAALEKAYGDERGNKEIVKTTFAMKPVGEGFEFVVVGQQAGEP